MRSAEGAGRERRRRAGPQLGARDAGCRPRLGRRGRAPAGRGGQEPRALPRRDQGPAALGLGRRRRRRDDDVGGRPLRRRASSCSAPRERVCARSCAAPATTPSRSRSTGKVESLNVSVAAGAAALRGEAAARWLSRRSTSSTATTCCTRAPFDDPRELVDRLASFVALHGARGVVVFDGVGEERDARPARGALRRARRRAARAAGGRAPRERDGLPRLVGLRCARHLGSGGAEAQLANLPRDLEEPRHEEPERSQLRDRVDEETRKRLEKLRRGQGSG